MENLMISANAVLPMCLVMALGYGTRRLGWLRREEISTINKIAFRIFLPCLLYYNIYCSDLSGSFDPLLMTYAVGGVLLTFGLALGYTLLTEKLPERRGVLIQGMFRSNYVIMGIPVATALLGADQLGTVSILIAVIVPLFNMLAVVVLEVFRGQKPKPLHILGQIAKNPLVIGSVLGILTLVAGIRLPHILEQTIQSVSAIASPLQLFLLGAIPFVLTGDIPNYIDALFETISGLTTTGASVVTSPESMTRGGMFWRLFTHWIGGMGILVFVLAVLPMSGNRSMHIMRAEVPGPTVGKLVPRIRKTASILYLLYIALTLVETVLLIAGGMSFYDALLHSFATAGTGGLSTRALSIGYYNSAYIDIVVGVFMILFGANFSLYYLILLGNIRTALRNEELRWFLGIIAFAVLTIAVDIRNLYGGVGHALRYSFFQVTSIISTTGFATADFNLWPEYSKFLLVLLMFVGGCAGSTAGGLKVSRVMLLFKSCTIEVKKMLRPRCVENVRLDGKPVDGQTVYNALTYFTFYIIIMLIAGLIVSLDGLDFTTNFTAALSCLSNVGPGLSLVGPTGSFAIFSPLSKIVLMICMLLGRLEIFPLLLLFVPFTWRWK